MRPLAHVVYFATSSDKVLEFHHVTCLLQVAATSRTILKVSQIKAPDGQCSEAGIKVTKKFLRMIQRYCSRGDAPSC